jgi:hypothetical protein
MAREVAVEENPEAFDRTFRKVVRAPKPIPSSETRESEKPRHVINDFTCLCVVITLSRMGYPYSPPIIEKASFRQSFGVELEISVFAYGEVSPRR